MSMPALLALPSDGIGGRPLVVAAAALRLVVATFFVFLAWKNLAGDQQMAADFARWGYPEWFPTGTAVIQILGALLLLNGATCFLGGLLLTGVLIGATITHLVHDPPLAALSPVIVLALVGFCAWVYRPAALR